MKKLFLIPMLLLTLFVGVNKVHAETSQYVSGFYTPYEFYTSVDITIIDNLTSYYTTNFSATYPFYIIYKPSDSNVLRLTAYKTNSFYYYETSGLYPNSNNDNTSYQYDFTTNTYSTVSGSNFYKILWYSSNTDIVLASSDNCTANITSRCADIVQLPSYSNLSLNVSYPQYDLEKGDIIPTYLSLTNGQPSADFTTVDMSDYDYIILSLRDYNTQPFNTTIYSLGRLCFTSVYDYGMKQKNEYINGYQTMGCTDYYNTFTPVNIYILQSDITNHAVYYVKSYDNETNILKIPTSIFDITYITSNETDPQVEINGRSYPVIPFNDLTDTANISTNEGYMSGRVCALGDVNCQAETMGMDISDLFTHPLTLLQSIWGSITSVFILIGEFIFLIPSPLKEFLIASFMLAIILGILKIIL